MESFSQGDPDLPKNYQEYLNVGGAIARQAKKILTEAYTKSFESSYKLDGTVVTDVDLAVSQMVLDSLHTAYPDHSIVAEEGGLINENAEYTWVCDPLDGTILFQSWIPLFCFSLALVKNGLPVLGIVTVPIIGETYTAVIGGGAFKNGKRIEVSNHENLNGSVFSVETWKNGVKDIPDARTKVQALGCTYLSFNSAVYSSMLVASGYSSAYVTAGKNPWDYAAAKIIIEEAGGKCTDFSGNDQRYDQQVYGFVASNGLVHQEVLDFIR